MSNTYYLVASLPTLVLGEPPPYSGEEMLRRCANVLDLKDLNELALVLDGRAAEGRTDFAKRWVNAEAQVRNAAARLRAGRRGVEARPYQREHEGYSVAIDKAVGDAYTKANPLERELEIDRLRWRVLDEMILTEPFGLAAVLAFALKLGIVTRWAGLKEDVGRRQVEELLGKVEAA